MTFLIPYLSNQSYGLKLGLLLGLCGGGIGLLVAVAGPIIAAGAVLGLLAGLFVTSNISLSLYGVILVAALIPFGTLPFRIGLTPTFLDLALGAFVLVYAVQWISGRRSGLRLTPINLLIAVYVLWQLLAFALGLRFASPTSTIARQFVETLLSISLTFVLVDLLRDSQSLRRLVLVIMLAVGAQAVTTLTLYALPDELAERTLIRLARIGYPDGGVIRYIEDNPEESERAIGTWVDPNALGGILAISAVMIAPQVFAHRPVLPQRWLTFGLLGLVSLALVLTFSRASMLAFGLGVAFIACFRGYRRYFILILIGVILLLILPQTRGYIERFAEAFTGTDLATQMRLGEYGDALELISEFPITGVGFTGTPRITLYTDVASMYLIMANQIGLVGVGLFGLSIVGVFSYGWIARREAALQPEMESIHLGYHAAVLAALINATADLYFFRLDFHASITFFWITVALALASSRLLLEPKTTSH